MSLADSPHFAVPAFELVEYDDPPAGPSETVIATPDDRPWPAEREEITIEVSSATASREWFGAWFETALDLFNMLPDWNGSGELPVHAAAIKRAARVLDAMDLIGPGPALTPRHDGSVQLEWHRGQWSVEVVVRPSGHPEAWVFSGDDETTWPVRTASDAIRITEAVSELAGQDA